MLLSLNDQVWTKSMTTSKKFFCGTLCQRLGKYCANLNRQRFYTYQVIKYEIGKMFVTLQQVFGTIRKLADEEKEKVKDAQGNDFKQNSIWSHIRQAAGEMLAGRWSLAVNEVDQFAQCLQCQ